VQAHGIAQMLANLVGHLVRLDIEIGGAIIVDDGKGQRDRSARYVATADIERPGDAVESGEDGAIQLALGQPFGDCGALFSAAFAGIFIAQHDQLGIGRIGAPAQTLSIGFSPTATSSAPTEASAFAAASAQPLVCTHGS